MTTRSPTRNSAAPWLSAFAAAVVFASVSPSHAADCVKNTELCVEGPATRDIGGYPVYRDCWRTTS